MGPKCWRTYRSSANKTSTDWLSNSSVQWAKLAARRWAGGKKRSVVGFCLSIKAAVNGWEVERALGCACHRSGPDGSVEIAEVPFTSNRKNPVNIRLFNNPECAAQRAFWRLWGLHFPLMYFHCQTLYLKSSKMELVTFSLFFHSFNPTSKVSNSISLVQDALLYWWGGGWVGIQVGCSFPLGFLSPGNGTPGDSGEDVTDKKYIYIFLCALPAKS